MKPIYLVVDDVAYRITTQDGYDEVADMLALGTVRAKRITESEFLEYDDISRLTDCIIDKIGAVDGGVFYLFLG